MGESHRKRVGSTYVRDTEGCNAIKVILREKYTGNNTGDVAIECGKTKRQVWSVVSGMRRKGENLPKTDRVYKNGSIRVNNHGTRYIKKNGRWVTDYKKKPPTKKEQDRVRMFVKDHYYEMNLSAMAKGSSVSERTISEHISKLKADGILKDKTSRNSKAKLFRQVPIESRAKKEKNLDFVTHRIDSVYTTKKSQEGLIPIKTDDRTVKYLTPEQANNYYANQRQNG